MANSAVQTSLVERRNAEPNVKPVWEQVLTFTVEADGGAAELTIDVPVDGILLKVIAAVGAAAGITGTVNLAIDDDRGNEIFAVTSLAESSSNKYDLYEAVATKVTVGVNPSDDPTTGQADWVIVVTLRGI